MKQTVNTIHMKTMKHLLVGAVTVALCVGAAGNVRAQDSKTTSDTTSELIDGLKKSSAAAADPELKSLGKDLTSKVGSLNTSLASAGNTAAQGQLQSALGGLTGKSSPVSTLTSLQQLSQAKLTPEQTKLAKDVYNTGSAYLVQKNLGGVEGAQSEVAQVVGALKKGSPTEAIAPLKTIGQNAKLTDGQKEFVQSLVKSYVPGAGKVDDVLKGIPGLGK
jgi:hypothetical protein